MLALIPNVTPGRAELALPQEAVDPGDMVLGRQLVPILGDEVPFFRAVELTFSPSPFDQGRRLLDLAAALVRFGEAQGARNAARISVLEERQNFAVARPPGHGVFGPIAQA